MITKTIKYIDVFTSEPKEVTLYFHLNKFEWLELETYTKGGLVENLKTALLTNNTKKTIDILKKIVLRAYGEKDIETGKFVKTEELAIDFSKTEAFSILFYELAYDADASTAFFEGLLPPDIVATAKNIAPASAPIII